MKKSFVFCCALISLLANAAAVEDNFEGKLSWSHWHSPKNKVRYTIVPGAGIDGSKAAAIQFLKPSTPLPENGGCLLKNFDIEPKTTYKLTFEFKFSGTSADAACQANIQEFGEKNKFIGTLSRFKISEKSDKYRKVTISFRTTKNVRKLRILLGGYGSDKGYLYFDNVKIEKVNFAEGFTESFDALGWGSWKFARAKLKISHDLNVGNKEKGSGCIEVLPENPLYASGCILTHIPVVPGKEYTFLIYVKAEGFAPERTLSMSLQGEDENGKFLPGCISSTKLKAENCREWKRMALTFQVPTKGNWGKAHSVQLVLSAGGNVPGKAWFDDFEMFPNDDEE